MASSAYQRALASGMSQAQAWNVATVDWTVAAKVHSNTCIYTYSRNVEWYNVYNMYRLKHGFECHTGYNGTVATSARGPQAGGRKPQRCHYSPYGARSHALTYL